MNIHRGKLKNISNIFLCNRRVFIFSDSQNLLITLPYTHTIFRILRMIDLLKITIKRSSRQVLTLSLFLSLSHSLSFSISTSHTHTQTHTHTHTHKHMHPQLTTNTQKVFSNFFWFVLKNSKHFSKKLKTVGKKLSNLKKLGTMFNKNMLFFLS